MIVRKLKVNETASVLKQIRTKQGNVCAICKQPFTKADGAVLDHCHETGFLRGVLHRSCNGGEGKVRIKAKWSHKGVTPDEFLIGLGQYLTEHTKPKYAIQYHTFKTQDEKRLERNRKARMKAGLRRNS